MTFWRGGLAAAWFLTFAGSGYAQQPTYWIAKEFRQSDLPADTALIDLSAAIHRINNAGDFPVAWNGDNEYMLFHSDGALRTVPTTSSKGPLNPLSFSERGSDGAFNICGILHDTAASKERGFVMRVKTGKPATISPLPNLVLPPDSQAPGEQNYGRANAVNSSGRAVGNAQQYLAFFAVDWVPPYSAARQFPDDPYGLRASVSDIDEQGNTLFEGGDNLPGWHYFTAQKKDFSLPETGLDQVRCLRIKGGRVLGVGYGQTGYYQPFVWTPRTGRMQFLELGQFPGAEMTDLNGHGDAVGGFAQGSGNYSPALWKRGTDGSYSSYRLEHIVPHARGYGLADGTIVAINDRGDLVVRVPTQQDGAATLLLVQGEDPRPYLGDTSLPPAFVGKPYRYQLRTTKPATFNAISLPAGLSFNPATGVISGTPTKAVTEFVFKVTPSNAAGAGVPLELRLDVHGLPTVQITAPAPAATVSPTGFTFSAEASSTAGILSVAFVVDGQIVARDQIAPYQIDVDSLSPGDHELAAEATDLNGAKALVSQRVSVAAVAGQGAYRYTGPAGGAWNEPSNWTPNGVPGANDAATIIGGHVKLPNEVTVGTVWLEGGTVEGPGTLAIAKTFNWRGGLLQNCTLTVAKGAVANLTGAADKEIDAIVNNGTIICSGKGFITGGFTSYITNNGLFTYAFQAPAGAPENLTRVLVYRFTNNGTLRMNGGLLRAHEDILNRGDGLLELVGPQLGITDNSVQSLLQAIGFEIGGGTVTGSGKLIGDVSNTGGTISPGRSPGVLTIEGNYSQGAAGTLVLEAYGTDPFVPQFDQLHIKGTASLGGKLVVQAFDALNGATIAPMTYASATGKFASVSSNAQAAVGNRRLQLAVNGPNPAAPKPLNISTRMRVETGDNVLIAGFIITGEKPKKVIIRGIGPSLPVPGALADPMLDLDNGTRTNDDWRSNQEAAIIASKIPPQRNEESAIVATLNPGPHTAILKGKGGGTGVGLVEVYDLEAGTPVQLANISTRGRVNTGDNVMIGGFIIGGAYPTKVLIRAIGPSLADAGVAGALEDPMLELVDANGSTISNDNWRSVQESEIASTFVAPQNDKESAIVATLAPGSYTAIVRGRNNTTGVALVEAYNIP